MKPNDKEISTLLARSAEMRYKYSIKRIADTDSLWTIMNYGSYCLIVGNVNLSTVWISGISYNQNRMAESINHFSGCKCSFDYETTAINSKKRFGLCFWTTILPIILGIVLCVIIIKCTKG